MSRIILAVSVVILLPASVFAYIGSGFKSEIAYQRHLWKQRRAKIDAEIGRATEAIQRNPKDAVAYFYRANARAQLDYGSLRAIDYKQTLADYDKAIELDPKFTKAYFNRGQLRLRDHPFERAEALADVEKAIQLDPQLVEAQLFLAVNTKDIAKAIEASKKACELTDYKGPICLQLLASFYAQNGDFDNAVRWQEKALKVVTWNVEVAKKRLEYYRIKKRNEWPIHDYLTKYEAQAARQRRWRAGEFGRMTEAIHRNPKDANAYYCRGNIYAEGGGPISRPNYEAALADYDKAIELNPKFAQAYFRRGQIRLWVLRQIKAENPLEERNKETPFTEADAVADLEKATQLMPDFAQAQVLFAVFTTDVAKAGQAAKRACQNLDLVRGDSIWRELLASYYAKNGDFDNAVRWQEKALRLSPPFPEEAKKRLENYRQRKPNEWEIGWGSLTDSK
ncbi:MAG TPA: tetratricopeptide repeat protein [Gemmataceae bacterium]|jgi:tetratricopeptide (TPR) repeat protein